MRIKTISSSLVLVLISGCAMTPKQEPVFVPAKQQISASPLSESLRSSKSNYHLSYGSDPALEHAFAHYLESGKAANIVTTEGFIKYAYSADQAPIIKAAPLQETVISLEPGEKFSNISSGDPSRWSYAVAVSGQGTLQQQNILIKPSAPSIGTNMVITTNKRIYTLRLVSMSNPDASSMRVIRFWYPDEMRMATQATEDETSVAANVSLDHLNFNYHVSGAGWHSSLPSWAPTRIFDDGVHTYIQFPASIAARDMPILFIRRDDKNELVNYRYQAPYFVVDKLFKQAVLLLGVGREQKKILITNKMITR
jgi:P-type conjugative transfer protein TrbG